MFEASRPGKPSLAILAHKKTSRMNDRLAELEAKFLDGPYNKILEVFVLH
jgi:hypothetical protein